MKISSIKLKNYRRLADVNLVLDDKTTVLVGANNSGKTSCIGALHTFLVRPENLKVRDISKRNWKKIRELGEKVEKKFPSTEEMGKFSKILGNLLPSFDIEISAEASEAYKVRDILPDLEWSGGALSVRMTYEASDLSELIREYTKARTVVSGHSTVSLWPKNLFDFLEKGRNFSKFIKQKHYILSWEGKTSRQSRLQPLKVDALKKLIRVDVISEQRGLGTEDSVEHKGAYSEKQRLNKLLREYYERFLNPEDFPEVGDLEVLKKQQEMEDGFTERLGQQFKAPLLELEAMGYPSIGGKPTFGQDELKVTRFGFSDAVSQRTRPRCASRFGRGFRPRCAVLLHARLGDLIV
jgi:predicted ATP-dependent endonuclease of OLD family